MADNKLQPEHLQDSHSAVADFIVSLVLTNLTAVLSVVLQDSTKRKRFRKVLKQGRDLLDNANLDG